MPNYIDKNPTGNPVNACWVFCFMTS